MMNYPMQWNMPQQAQNPWDFNWTIPGANMNQGQGYNPNFSPSFGLDPNDPQQGSIAQMLSGMSANNTVDPNSAYGKSLNPQGINWNGALQNFSTAAEGLSSLGSMWTGLKGLDLAKDTFKFQKNMYATNLQNQAQDLNRRLESSYRDNDFLTGGNTGYSSLEDYLGKHGFSGEMKTLGKKNQRQA